MSEPVNGSPAPPAAAPEPDQGSVTERMMGLFGLAVALGVAIIAIDLISGGAVSRLFGQPPPEADD